MTYTHPMAKDSVVTFERLRSFSASGDILEAVRGWKLPASFPFFFAAEQKLQHLAAGHQNLLSFAMNNWATFTRKCSQWRMFCSIFKLGHRPSTLNHTAHVKHVKHVKHANHANHVKHVKHHHELGPTTTTTTTTNYIQKQQHQQKEKKLASPGRVGAIDGPSRIFGFTL